MHNGTNYWGRSICDRTHTKTSFSWETKEVSEILRKPITNNYIISIACFSPFSHSPTKPSVKQTPTNLLCFSLSCWWNAFPARNCKTQQQLLSDRAGGTASVVVSAGCIPLSRCSAGNGAGAGHPFAGDSAGFLESFQDTVGGKPSPRWRCPVGPAWQKTLQTACASWRPPFPPELSDRREGAVSNIVQVPPVK